MMSTLGGKTLTTAVGGQGIPCDMAGGSSGGPWLITNNTVLNPVNSFGYQGLRNVMFGQVLRLTDPELLQHRLDPLTRSGMITFT
jgi:hypothetical protein